MKHQLKCQECGMIFSSKHIDGMFCSGKCSSKAWRKRRLTTINCIVCGKEMEKFHNRTVCSDECAKAKETQRLKNRASGVGKGWNKGREFVERKTCLYCEELFYAPPILVKRGGGKYCSKDCRFKHMAVVPGNISKSTSRRGIAGVRADLGDIYFRSSWEANYARYLNLLIEKGEIRCWKYEVKGFEIQNSKNMHVYIPDFQIEMNDGEILYHEVKGRMDERSQTKLSAMKIQHPSIQIVLIGQKEYKLIEKVYKNLIPQWEKGRFTKVNAETISTVETLFRQDKTKRKAA